MIDRKKWFEENQWFLKAIENGDEVEFSSWEDFRTCVHSVPTGFDLDDGRIYRFEFGASQYARPIPKKKMRMMTREEILCFILDRPRILVACERISGDMEEFKIPSYYAFDADNALYEYIEIPEGYHGDFSDLPVKKFETEVTE